MKVYERKPLYRNIRRFFAFLKYILCTVLQNSTEYSRYFSSDELGVPIILIKHRTTLSEIRNLQKQFNEAEHLVHETKKNHARFAFGRHFPKMPSYLR